MGFFFLVGGPGGVTSMNDFLIKFFPVVYKRKLSAQESDYCKYDNQGLQAFTSSLYIAGLLATLVASYTTRKWGRKATMFIGGTSYLVGSILNAAAQDLAMLIIGRIMLGIGVGFGNQVRLFFLIRTPLPFSTPNFFSLSWLDTKLGLWLLLWFMDLKFGPA